jgi:hypothetical protein
MTTALPLPLWGSVFVLGLRDAWEGFMRLGYIRIPDQHPIHETRVDMQEKLALADRLEFDIAYLPNTSPQHLQASLDGTNHPRIALDASAFGPLAPSDLEAAVRTTNHRFGGNLRLGVEMSCASVSTKCKTNAQAFETMFSHDPRPERVQSTSRYPMKPPCPEIIGVPVTGHRDEVAHAAARGYLPMTPSWLADTDVARHWPAIVQGATSAVRRARPSHWQLARMIVVHDDPASIDAYVFGRSSPIRRHFVQLSKRGLIGADVDTHMKRVVIAGSASKVAEEILALRETVGEFGTLHVVDPLGSDPSMTRNTMVRLVQNVMPMIGKSDTSTPKKLEKT